jgi:hypothetical protein
LQGEPASVNVIGKCSSLADAANSPRPTAAAASAAAASTASAASAASATTSAAPAASAASAASATSGKLLAEPGCSRGFLVEDIERRQAHVGDFLLAESDLVRRHGIPRLYICCRPSGCCGRAARQRQRHADESQHRYGFLPTPSLRNLLRMWHSRGLPCLPANVRACSTVRTPCIGTLQGRLRPDWHSTIAGATPL